MNETDLGTIRRRLIKSRGVEFKKLSRKPIPIEEVSTLYKKTNLMRLTELRFKDKPANLISKGTIYEVGRKLGINATTVSKWRKLITQAKDAEFFAQFELGKEPVAVCKE